MVGTLGRGNLREVTHLHRPSVRGWAPSSLWLRSPTFIAAVAIGAATFVLSLVYATTAPTDVDGIQYAVGSRHFDVTHLAPQAPGSWLYVAAGHALHVVSGLGTVRSLVLLSALAAAAAAALTCVAGTALGGRSVGVASAVFVATAPVSWFSGSTVSTYGIDAFLAALLIVLARRARPYRAHGLVAVLALGLAGGVRLSVILIFAPLAAIAVVGSVRTVGQLLATVVVGLASVAAWFVPMIAVQPGGLHAWFHALHVLISTAAHTSSVFVAGTPGALTNVGTFGAWTLLSLAPVMAIGVLAVLVVAGARLVTSRPGGNVSLRIWSRATEPADRIERPWYQSTGVILAAALLPPLAFVTLGQFTVGGDVLSYLVPATLLFLLPVARLLHHRVWALRRASAVAAALLVGAAVFVNLQRFVSAPGILPASVASAHRGLWLSQTRYQSPYPDTADTIRATERTARAIDTLRSVVNPAIDVVVCLTAQNGYVVTRTVGLELPDTRVALFLPYRYMEFDGLVYRPSSTTTLEVGPGGHVDVLSITTPRALTELRSSGLATETTAHVHRYRVWRVSPGATLFGVTVTAVSGPRPLGLPVS